LTSKLNLAKVSIAEGHPQSAVRDLRAFPEQAAAAGLQYLSLDGAVTLGEALLANKNYDQSRMQLEGALTKSERLGLRAQTARIHYLIANAMAGNPEAEAHYKQSIAMLDDLRKEDGATHLLDRFDLRSMYADATHRSSTGATLAHN
jgi:hypothetical protein